MPHSAAAQAPPPPPPLRFGSAQGSRRFELQPAERRLLVDGRPAPLGVRALDVLIALAMRPDRLVSKNELLDLAWPGVIVEEANLHVQISHLRKQLGGDIISTVPGRGYRFVALVERRDADGGRPAAVQPRAAPPAPPPAPAIEPPRLYGRETDLAELERLLTAGGCVTVVGTSGVGKTSLARAAAARWRGPTLWLDLTTLTQGPQVTTALARALGLPPGAVPEDDLARALQGRGRLLVLDNAEHLVESCAALAARLAPLPGVTLLATSQLPLAVAGERVQRLDPLSLPEADAEALADGALALLIERIVAADHRFSPAPSTLPLLRSICRQLDGLPLALEMAAARVPQIGVRGVCDALAERFALLTRGHRNAAPRHRTLHQALDWSYQLLSPAEQHLLRAVGVFGSGFTLELAVALVAGPDAAHDSPLRWDVIDALAGLVDRSLVVASADEVPRYRLLESTRAYALARLAEAADGPAEGERWARQRHAAALLALIDGVEPLQAGPQRLALCEAELANVRDAIAWAAVHELPTAARLSMAAARVSSFGPWRDEATNWLAAIEAAMAGPAGLALPASLQAAWWTELARMLSLRTDPRSRDPARRAVELWRGLGEPSKLLYATVVWVRSVREPGAELDEACAALQAQAAAMPELTARERWLTHAARVSAELARQDYAAVLAGRLEEIDLARQLGAPQAVEAAESNVVHALLLLGRPAEAAERAQALLDRVDQGGEGDRNGNLPWVLRGLVEARVELGQLDRAQALLPRALAAGRRFHAPVMWPLLPLLLARQGQPQAAARMIGHLRELARRRGADMTEAGLVDRARAIAEAALGSAAVEALAAEGAALDEDQAAALVGGLTPP